MNQARNTYLLAIAAFGAHLAAAGCRPPSQPVASESATKEKPSQSVPNTPREQGAKVIAYSGQAISRSGPIKVVFDKEIVSADLVGTALAESPFELDPPLDGYAVWITKRELQYQLKTPLAPGQTVIAKVALNQLPAPTESSELKFKFWPIKLDYQVVWLGWRTEGSASTYQAEISTSDRVESEAIEKMLAVSKEGDELKTRWLHTNDRNHRFIVQGISRTATPGSLHFEIAGEPIDIERKETKDIVVPAENAFIAMSARHSRNESITVRFSDPVHHKQNFAKYVKIEGASNLSFKVRGETLRIFNKNDGWDRDVTLTLLPGLRRRNTLQTLREAQVFSVRTGPRKPQVRFIGKGVVIPSQSNSVIPIETANLSHIRVEATRVPSHNLSQFLQVNDLDQSTELIRVGQVVWSKRVDLEATTQDQGRWVRRGLDLRDLIKNDPKGLYRLRLSFVPTDVTIECPRGAFEKFNEAEFLAAQAAALENGEPSNWDYWNNNYFGSYQHRKDPCHLSYFRQHYDHDITASRNIIFSDIGVIAKQGSVGQFFVAATRLSSSQPIANATVTVKDYQHLTLGSGTTDERGFASLTLKKGRPFSVFVQHEDQVGVVRLKDGKSLSIAHFDTGGASVQKGVKGFIYGERGVWRPGDTIHLGFVLFDPADKFPENHPVRLTVRNPQYQLIFEASAQSPHNIYRFDVPTSLDAATGSYSANVSVGPVSFSKALNIETVVPNRLKIDLNFGTELLKGPIAQVDAELQSRWLHGAIARDLRTSLELAFTPSRTRFAEYSAYNFDDPTRKFSSETKTIFEGKLDDAGKVQIQAELEAEGRAAGMLTANFVTRVFEESGQASVDRHSIKFSPYERYIGVQLPKGDAARGMLLTDTIHTAKIAAVDAEGKPVDTEVKVNIYKIRWRWWWEKGAENLADYNESSSHTAIASGTVDVRDGQGEFDFEVKYPDWGRYLITVADINGAHRTGRTMYIDWPGWAGRQQKDSGGAAHRLSLSANKKRVNVGENFTLTFPSPQQGRALLSIESGSKVISTQWVEPKESTTQVVITATPDMAPSVYANISLLQPYDGRANDRPMRLYGITPIQVVDPSTELKPILKAPKVVEPEAQFNLEVAEANGEPMAYTVAIVDEGLLGLTRFRTPNPWKHFYRRESLGVKTWDIYDYVAGAYAGTLETLLAIGGGDAEDEAPTSKVQRFKPVVKVLGPFTLDKGEKKRHSVKLPPYLGEVRAMVVASGKKAFGKAEAPIRVTKPLMVISTLPRVLGPRESVKLPVSIFVSDESIKNVRLTVRATGPVFLKDEDRTQDIAFTSVGDQTVQIPIEVGAQPGVAQFTITVEAGDERFEETTEVAVRYPSPPSSTVLSKSLQAGESWSPEIIPVGIQGTNNYVLELSRIPSLNLEQYLSWLIRYPHGCLEQTTSAAFPQVYLSRLMDLTEQEDSNTRHHVSTAIHKLQGLQNASGGFTYWPGNPSASEWSTSWAGHFLLEAQKAGFPVEPSLLANWMAYQKQTAREWVDKGDTTGRMSQAYRLYTLALAGSPDVASMNRLKESHQPSVPGLVLKGPTRLRLAAAYALAGDKATAQELLQEKISFTEYRELGGTFGTKLRDQAMALETYLLLGDKTKISLILKEVVEGLNKGQHTTHELSFALIALARYGLQDTPSTVPRAKLKWSGKDIEVELKKPLARIPLASANTPKLEVSSSSQHPLFATLIVRGHPDIKQTPALESGLSVSAQYRRGDVAIAPNEALEGDDIVVTVSIRNTSNRDLEGIALSHLVPTGWIVRNDRLDGRTLETAPFDYQDLRDDRVLSYFDLKRNKSKTIRIRAHAQFPGRFFLAPIRAEAMYDPHIHGETASSWVEVSVPGPTS